MAVSLKKSRRARSCLAVDQTTLLSNFLCPTTNERALKAGSGGCRVSCVIVLTERNDQAVCAPNVKSRGAQSWDNSQQ